VFEADWVRYGNSAGPIRNQQMTEYADAAVIGTVKVEDLKDIFLKAKKNNLKVFSYIVDEPNI